MKEHPDTMGALSPNQWFGYVVGAVYVVVGLAGFAVTGGVGFADTSGESLLGFEVNPLHNLVHILVGLTLAAGARMGGRDARLLNTSVGGTYLAVGIIGFFVTGASINILALNHPDNLLHVATAATAIGVAAGDRPAAVTT